MKRPWITCIALLTYLGIGLITINLHKHTQALAVDKIKSESESGLERTSQIQEEFLKRKAKEDQAILERYVQQVQAQSPSGQELETLIEALEEQEAERTAAETSAEKIEEKLKALESGIANNLAKRQHLREQGVEVQEAMTDIVETLQEQKQTHEALRAKYQAVKEAQELALKRQLSLENAIRLSQEKE